MSKKIEKVELSKNLDAIKSITLGYRKIVNANFIHTLEAERLTLNEFLIMILKSSKVREV